MRLRQARQARGWSQAKLIYEIEQYARRHALDIATTASLRVYVSMWENERRPISPEYAAILRALFGLTDAELLAPSPTEPSTSVDGYDELVSRIESARAISRSMLDTLTAQTELIRTMERQIGAASQADYALQHLDRLQETLAFAVLPDARRPVARALAEAASLTAWLALDVGAADRAWRHYELAKTAAQEADSPLYLAHSMGEQAYVLSDAGRPELALELIQEAQRVGGSRISPRLSAWLYAAEAELQAFAGNPDACHRALDAAERILPPGSCDRDPELPSVFLNEAHLTRWRGNTLVLLGDDRAVSELYAALAAMDSTFVRAQAGLRCGLAHAHLVRGEVDEARVQLREARLVANRVGSVRHRRRIDRLTGMC